MPKLDEVLPNVGAADVLPKTEPVEAPNDGVLELVPNVETADPKATSYVK